MRRLLAIILDNSILKDQCATSFLNIPHMPETD